MHVTPRLAASSLLFLALCTGGGCRRGASSSSPPRDPIPLLPWVDEAAALRTLAERGRAVKAVRSESVVTITKPDGSSVRLDGAVVLAPPDRARLRAWKLGQAVFDLTLTPDGLWVFTGREPGQPATRPAFPKNTTQLVRQWTALMTSFFEQDALAVERRGPNLLVRKTLDDRSAVTSTVDRATLTPRVYIVTDPRGKTRFELTMSQYRETGGVVWPTLLVATSEQGKVTIEMRDVELTGRISPKTFVPPRRSEKLP